MQNYRKDKPITIPAKSVFAGREESILSVKFSA